jgi:HSP20 family molecular chaperone IbpA
MISTCLSALCNFNESLKHNDDSLDLILCVPGHNKNTLSISVEDSLLSVTSNYKKENIPSVNYKYRLNTDRINSKNITAKCEDGLLYISIPKKTKKNYNITIN